MGVPSKNASPESATSAIDPAIMSTKKNSVFDGESREPINREARSIFGKPETDDKGIPISELSRAELMITKQAPPKLKRRPNSQSRRNEADQELRVGAVFGHVKVMRQREDHYFLWDCECDCGKSSIIERGRFLNGEELCRYCKGTGKSERKSR